jgi:hypothetical protein
LYLGIYALEGQGETGKARIQAVFDGEANTDGWLRLRHSLDRVAEICLQNTII